MLGIGITTRNRNETLAWSLKHFETFLPSKNYKIVVVDDNSCDDHKIINEKHCANCKYIYNVVRKGIAGSKNVCLNELKDCEEVFLFDDDCFPIKNNWDLPFSDLVKLGIQHSSFNVFLGNLHHNKIFESEEYFVLSGGQGMCLFFTRKCLDAIGQYDENFGIYGYEHCDMSYRAKKEGFCKRHKLPYITPNGGKDHLFSLDLNYGVLHENSPLGPFNFSIASSVPIDSEERNNAIKISESNFKLKKYF